MEIKKFKEYTNKVNEKARTELFGTDRKPSNVISRQDQDFYDFYTHRKFRGKSKYELNSEIFKLAQRNDEIGTLAQFCLQIERESIAADDYIVSVIDDFTKNKLDVRAIDNGDYEDDSKLDNEKLLKNVKRLRKQVDENEEDIEDLNEK